ncbi:hypothetical protein JXA47_05190 [Candidatus Sumerlaeota bacterium]|nr:hypothetical protein [Candidatus Sumerlaeota bacterium]
MPRLLPLIALTLALAVSVGAQSVDALIEEAAQPVSVDLAIGISVSGRPAQMLANAGLLGAVPARVAVVSINSPSALEGRAEAERALAARGPSIVDDLIAEADALPVGLFIPAGVSPSETRLRGEIRGLNLERVFVAMGPGSLDELENLSRGSSEVAQRAGELLDQLSQLDIEILSSGEVRLEGETIAVRALPEAVESHGLARTAHVVAPGDMSINQIIPVLEALRSAGLSVEVDASSGAVVTISSDGD